MSNGGTVNKAYDIYMGTAITLPSPTPGDQPTFEGWYTAASGGTKIGDAGASYIPTANITLYAQWSSNIPVEFDANGGSCSTQRLTYDGAAPITLPSATRPGHSFNGWYTASSGGTKIGNAGASYIPTAHITLYAQWTAYTVTYDANGGSVSPASSTAGSNGAVTLPTPTRTGYTFNGWYTAASGGTKIGSAGASYTPTANITLYAQWSVNSYKVNITTSNSSTAVTVNGTTVNNGGSVDYNSTVKVVLNYSKSSEQTFTIKQGSTNVTRYSNEDCTKTTTSTDAGTYYFKMPAGDVTINSSSCIAAGTLITLADGSRKPVEDLTGDEMLLVWDLEKGRYAAAPIVFIDSDPEAVYEIIELSFSDGTSVKVISEHGFFDYDEAKYIYLDEHSGEYIGHRFVKEDGTTAVLIGVSIYDEITTAWSPVTFGHLCYYTNGMLSMPGGISGLFNIFEVNADTMTYDPAAMQKDILRSMMIDHY